MEEKMEDDEDEEEEEEEMEVAVTSQALDLITYVPRLLTSLSVVYLCVCSSLPPPPPPTHTHTLFPHPFFSSFCRFYSSG